MKITILTSYYSPEITAATHLLDDLSNDLSKYGAEVTVITNFPSRGISEEERIKYFDLDMEERNSNLKIIRVGKKSLEGKSFLKRGLRYIQNTAFLYKEAKKIKSDIYFILSTPPTLGIVGVLLSKKNKVVYNLQDIFPSSLINSGKLKEKSLITFILKKFESLVYKKVDNIITITEDFKKHVDGITNKPSKTTLVYNWIDEKQVYFIEKKENKIFEKYELNKNKFYVTYCGNIGHSQNLEMVVDIAGELVNEDIEFIFIGDGAWKNNIINYINNKKISNVKVLPFQPYEDISHVMSLGDVSLVCSKANIGSSSFPSKTWSIMSAKRPVLCSFDENSELTELINNSNSGITVPPENKMMLKEAILNLYKNPKLCRKYGENGRKYIKKNLTRKKATFKYYEILEKIYNKN